MAEYSTPFNIKEELKKISERAKLIPDEKTRKARVQHETKQLREHEQMLKKMSAFVSAKDKNKK